MVYPLPAVIYNQRTIELPCYEQPNHYTAQQACHPSSHNSASNDGPRELLNRVLETQQNQAYVADVQEQLNHTHTEQHLYDPSNLYSLSVRHLFGISVALVVVIHYS